MKAVVLKGKNEPLIIEEVPSPVCNENEVLVKLKASAFNHRDLWIKKGMYAGLKYPCILGSDGSGVISDVSSNLEPSLLGKEVMINPSFNWGDNLNVQSKEYKILGLPDDGTFAEYVKVPIQNIHEKPSYLSFEESASIPLAGLTAYRALFSRANLKQGEKVLITGVGGGVALFAFQFALAIGAEVHVTSGSDEKITRALELGAKAGYNYKENEWFKKVPKNYFDVIIDSACGDSFANLIDFSAPAGRIAFFGGTTGNISNLSPQKIFWKQLSIFGSTMGNNEEFKAMLNFFETHKIKPILDIVLPLDSAEEAISRMNSTIQFGKIVLKNS